ncbi:MAG: hypothetical protein NZ750_14375 [Anaerolineae bacterium]|nr:hypothetical protein [Anaerolineae bacterium]MDW8170928.1 hypothetical protein [Anaerolineae bacterium]
MPYLNRTNFEVTNAFLSAHAAIAALKSDGSLRGGVVALRKKARQAVAAQDRRHRRADRTAVS